MTSHTRKHELSFEKKQLVEFLPRKRKVVFRGSSRPDECVRYGRCALVGLRADDVKAVSIERLCVSLSSCRKTFKIKKVNKSFEVVKFCRVFRFLMSISLIRIKIDNHFKLYHHLRHHHVMPQARISLTLSRHFSLSFIASGMSLGLYPVSSQSCCMYVRADRPVFASAICGIGRVHRSTSIMSSSLLLQQFPACLVRLTWLVFEHGR